MTDKKQDENTEQTQTLMDKLSVIKLNLLVVMVHVLSLFVCATVVIGFLATGHPLLMAVWLIAFVFIQYGITFNSIKLRKLYLYGDVYSNEDFF